MAARFITGARKYDHISPVLRDLHWLPLRQRIIFKIATLMHQCLNGLAPSYLATDCIAISSMPGRRQLRSATSGQLYIPRTKTMTFGPRSFKVSGPTIWNDLPARLKDSSLSKNSFRKLLTNFYLIDDMMIFGQMIFGQMIFGQMIFGQMIFGQMIFGQMIFGQLPREPLYLSCNCIIVIKQLNVTSYCS